MWCRETVRERFLINLNYPCQNTYEWNRIAVLCKNSEFQTSLNRSILRFTDLLKAKFWKRLFEKVPWTKLYGQVNIIKWQQRAAGSQRRNSCLVRGSCLPSPYCRERWCSRRCRRTAWSARRWRCSPGRSVWCSSVLGPTSWAALSCSHLKSCTSSVSPVGRIRYLLVFDLFFCFKKFCLKSEIKSLVRCGLC